MLPLVHLANAAIDGREMRLNASERKVHLADAWRDEHLRRDANHRRHADDGAAYLRDHHDRVGAHAVLAAPSNRLFNHVSFAADTEAHSTPKSSSALYSAAAHAAAQDASAAAA